MNEKETEEFLKERFAFYEEIGLHYTEEQKEKERAEYLQKATIEIEESGNEKIIHDIRFYVLQYDVIARAANLLCNYDYYGLCKRMNANYNYLFEWLGTARQYAYFIYKLSIEAEKHGQSIYKGHGSFDLHRFSLIFPNIKKYNNPQIDRKYLNSLKNGNEAPPKDYLIIDKAIKQVFKTK